jgi:hypothetical protein
MNKYIAALALATLATLVGCAQGTNTEPNEPSACTPEFVDCTTWPESTVTCTDEKCICGYSFTTSHSGTLYGSALICDLSLNPSTVEAPPVEAPPVESIAHE